MFLIRIMYVNNFREKNPTLTPELFISSKFENFLGILRQPVLLELGYVCKNP